MRRSAFLLKCSLITILRTKVCYSLQVPFSSSDASFGLDESANLNYENNPLVGKIFNEELTSYISNITDLWEVKGTAIAVVRPDGEVEFGAWGIKSEDGENMTPYTVQNIASCSKAFLSAAVGILMDDFQHGRNKTPLPDIVRSFNWRTKVKDVLQRDWELQDQWASEKSDFIDILSHRTGMPRHDSSYTAQDTALDMIRRLRHLRPAYEPRQKFAYNNQMFTVAAQIVKKYSSAQDYSTFVNERILEPLGMTSTTFSPKSAQEGGNLTQGWTAHGQRIPFWYTDASVDMLGGFAGIITNVADLSRWLQVLLNKGVDPISNKTIIPRSTYDMVTTAHTVMNGNPTASRGFSIGGYGMGWWRSSFKGHDMLQHDGALPGVSTSVTFFPNDGLGIAVLMNSGDKYEVNEAIRLRIAEEILGLERTARAETPTRNRPEQPERDTNASSPLPLSAYAGKYSNPGYGSITLCAPSSTSQYCNRVLDAFSIVEKAQNVPKPPNSTVFPQLYAEWSKFWTSHARLVHVEDNTFNVTLTALFPDGYGANKTPFETFEADADAGQAKFVLDKEGKRVLGIGYFGVYDEQRALGDSTSIEESSIAWFEKTA